jgi:serine/threonine protein kinase
LPYLVMNYIDGISLAEKIRQRSGVGPDIDAKSALFLLLKVCDAVNSAHVRGVVHRDLKPSNILVDLDGEPHVVDFGLARQVLLSREGNVGAITLTSEFLGSLPWAAPEQAAGQAEKIDSRTDVYALGVILYQIVTGGQFPYEVVGAMRDVLDNIANARPQPPSVVLKRRAIAEARRRRRVGVGTLVNAELDAIALKALAKSRKDRYQSAAELARDLENYLSGRPTMAARENRNEWNSAIRGRRKIIWVASLVVLLIVIVGVPWIIRLDPNHDDGMAFQPPAGEPTERPSVNDPVVHADAPGAAHMNDDQAWAKTRAEADTIEASGRWSKVRQFWEPIWRSSLQHPPNDQFRQWECFRRLVDATQKDEGPEATKVYLEEALDARQRRGDSEWHGGIIGMILMAAERLNQSNGPQTAKAFIEQAVIPVSKTRLEEYSKPAAHLRCYDIALIAASDGLDQAEAKSRQTLQDVLKSSASSDVIAMARNDVIVVLKRSGKQEEITQLLASMPANLPDCVYLTPYSGPDFVKNLAAVFAQADQLPSDKLYDRTLAVYMMDLSDDAGWTPATASATERAKVLKAALDAHAQIGDVMRAAQTATRICLTEIPQGL